MNPLQSLPSYEQFVYTLPQQTKAILRSTLVVVRRGATIAVLNGELEFIPFLIAEIEHSSTTD